MSEAVISAIITGVFSLIAIFASNKITQDKVLHSIEKKQVITDTKIEELTREVREHNNFARRMPVVEEQIKVINRRIDSLNDYRKDA